MQKISSAFVVVVGTIVIELMAQGKKSKLKKETTIAVVPLDWT